MWIDKACVCFLLLVATGVGSSHATSYRDLKTYQDVTALSAALDMFAEDAGRYPDTETGLEALLKGYLDRIPKDAWQNNYRYYYPPRYGNHELDLYSLGKNEIDDKGGGDDISNWNGVDHAFYPRYRSPIDYLLVIAPILLLVGGIWIVSRRIRKMLPNKRLQADAEKPRG